MTRKGFDHFLSQTGSLQWGRRRIDVVQVELYQKYEKARWLGPLCCTGACQDTHSAQSLHLKRLLLHLMTLSGFFRHAPSHVRPGHPLDVEGEETRMQTPRACQKSRQNPGLLRSNFFLFCPFVTSLASWSIFVHFWRNAMRASPTLVGAANGYFECLEFSCTIYPRHISLSPHVTPPSSSQLLHIHLVTNTLFPFKTMRLTSSTKCFCWHEQEFFSDS